MGSAEPCPRLPSKRGYECSVHRLTTSPHQDFGDTSLTIPINSTMEVSPASSHRLVHLSIIIPLVASLWIIGTLLYRLFFSPLSKLPGPWLTKISTILESNALKEQRRARWVTELFERNPGAVAIRTGPNSVSFNSQDAVKAIYGQHSCTTTIVRGDH